jgi:tRNA(Ile)-lysidine synthase
VWLARLRDEIRAAAPAGLCVAFSGGRDSTALLHALAQSPEARECGLRALHVDHGLHHESSEWAAHGERFCRSLDVPLVVLRVTVGDARGLGIEAAARQARYAAFAESLRHGEWLALAHHRDDQVETVLLKLLRGAGPEGLGGMRVRRPFARGSLWRPLLETHREDLERYLVSHGLEYLDDPANRDRRFARNILRHELIPVLERHWPRAGSSILHSAQLCRAAGDYLAREADTAFAILQREDRSLDADGWLALPEALRAPVLDRWLRVQDLCVPADAQRRELERQIATAAEDAVPCVGWRDTEVRVWDGRLHASPPLPALPADWQSRWSGEPLDLPKGCGTLLASPTAGATPLEHAPFDPPLEVRLRRGGEHIKPDGDPHTRELRDLFQQARIPPWVRERCPLVFAGDDLIAVADWWISESGRTLFATQAVQPRWRRPAWAAFRDTCRL